MQAPRRLLHCLTVALVASGYSASATSSSFTNHGITSAAPSITVCPARTINYITHALPQYCLTSSWTSSRPQVVETDPSSTRDANVTDISDNIVEHPQPTNATLQDASEVVSNDALPTTFMSFEDWKEMMLRRTGQDPQDLRGRRPTGRGVERVPPDSGHAGLGEEDEIYLNFDTFLHGDEKGTAESGNSNDIVQQKKDTGDEYRSKDAGKTCKERFSYSSFDAGATVLKSSPRTKNAKAILVENKDSYMLLECAADAKYVIVELSDDILVDTVVLANFEFFSSMVRHFRVSVSGRYPVDKWQELGIFEARNSRDIQPFLVENPMIFAKYIRIDFLTHFGNEYYCPVSLLRVHGSRMLDSWKEVAHQEEENPHLIEDLPQETTEDIIPATTAPPEPQKSADAFMVNDTDDIPFTSPRLALFASSQPTCKARSLSQFQSHDAHPALSQASGEELDGWKGVPTADGMRISSVPSIVSKVDSPVSAGIPKTSPSISSTATHPPVESRTNQPHNGTNVTNTTAGDTGPDSSSSGNRAAAAGASTKSRNVGGSGGAVTATVQEGFFNAITKRLQQVESNLTLSLKYVEDQSRYMQEALQRGEQKQLSKVTQFLETLNQTVLADLRHLRDQYDQIWQSTVIALESHREQSERDILALGSRLNLLADEVVFQKRMAIIQAVLLLSCLFLVIFSRGMPIPYFAPGFDQNAVPISYESPASISTRQPNNFRTSLIMPDTAVDGHPELNGEKHMSYRSVVDDRDVPLNSTEPRPEDQDAMRVIRDNGDLVHFRPLSPSPTPSSHTEAPDTLDFKPTRLTHSISSRQSSARKPLPALPEQGESP